MEKEYHYIQEILSPDFVGKRVKIRGWVYRQRNSKKMAFIVLRDGTETLQCTGKKDQLSEELFNTLCEVKYESSVIVEGNIKEDNRAPNGYELQINN